MRVSKLFTKTSKSAPADEVAKNAQLLIRAGYVHKEMAGVYSYLPLGLRVLNNIAQIVREEMDAIGGQELLMPALQVKERYEATGRWDDAVVDNWFKTKLANGAELGLGFSHEENLVPIIKQLATSYKDLPIAPYQIQTKFRNELRSKSGLMRGREFIMKDMYSFAITQAQHDEFYALVQAAYKRVYERLGLGERTVMALASGGSFSKYSHEFQTFSEAGEDLLFKTTDGVWHNREIAPSQISKPNESEALAEYKDVEGEGVVGVQALLEHLQITIEKSTKTLIYTTDAGEAIMAAVRSDYDVNELKLCEAVGCKTVSLASAETVREKTGAEIGYAGIVNVPEGVRIFLDDSLKGLCNFETGANKTHYHAVNVNFGRDIKAPERFYDFKTAREGDLDPASGEPMEVRKAIEVGNIFSLGTKFSQPFDLRVPDEHGEVITLIMGCYGIGVSRAMGTIAELMSDDKGLVWHDNIAPYRVYLARLGSDEVVVRAADELYASLQEAGVSVLYDDRDARPGDKFADADLLGLPHRVVVSAKTVEQGVFEYKKRTEQESAMVETEKLKDLLTAQK